MRVCLASHTLRGGEKEQSEDHIDAPMINSAEETSSRPGHWQAVWKFVDEKDRPENDGSASEMVE